MAKALEPWFRRVLGYECVRCGARATAAFRYVREPAEHLLDVRIVCDPCMARFALDTITLTPRQRVLVRQDRWRPLPAKRPLGGATVAEHRWARAFYQGDRRAPPGGWQTFLAYAKPDPREWAYRMALYRWSGQWEQLVQRTMERDRFRCTVCASPHLGVSVQHVSGSRPGANVLDGLEVRCQAHHPSPS